MYIAVYCGTIENIKLQIVQKFKYIYYKLRAFNVWSCNASVGWAVTNQGPDPWQHNEKFFDVYKIIRETPISEDEPTLVKTYLVPKI